MKPRITHKVAGGSAGVTFSMTLALTTMLCAISLRGQAQIQTNIAYTFSDTGSGSLGATHFTNAAFKIRVFADPNAVVPDLSEPGNTIFQVPALSSSIEVALLGVATFTTEKRVFVNQTASILGFSLPGDAGDLLDLSSPTFAAYDLKRAFRPLFAAGPHGGFGGEPSTLGTVTLSPIRDVTFVAAVAFPSLSIALNGNSVVLRWSTNSPGYGLQARDAASGNLSWTMLTNVPSIDAAQYVVTNLISAPYRFYLLQN